MSHTTIHFDNAHEAQELTGSDPDLLARVEAAFSVHLTARDTWLKVEGAEDQVARTVAFFNTLRDARNKGALDNDGSIDYALSAFLDDNGDRLGDLYADRIDVSPGKDPLFPKTFGQKSYTQAIRDHDITLGIGPAGTGKTYLAMAMAISALLRGDVSRIIMTRPAIEAGEALGFLPGDVNQKVYPYLRPLYDAMYDMMNPEDIEKNMERGVIEVAPLAYMRGRTLNHAFVILDEAQNTTTEQMLMFLTRLGFGSKCVVTGDLTQIDLPPNKKSGLVEARTALQRVDGIAVVILEDRDVVRHPLVQKVIHAYRHHRAVDAEGEAASS